MRSPKQVLIDTCGDVAAAKKLLEGVPFITKEQIDWMFEDLEKVEPSGPVVIVWDSIRVDV
jgi:hypothetical protein